MEQNYSSFADLYGQASRLVINNSASFQTMIKDEINRALADAANRHDWRELRRIETNGLSFSTTSSYFYCPSYVATALGLIDLTSKEFLEASQLEYLAWQAPSIFNTAGKPIQWADAGISATLVDFSATPETLNIVSSSSADTSQTVRVSGIDSNNVPLSEAVQLNGTTVVPTVNTYAMLESVSCDSNKAGIITYSGVTSLTTYGRIGPDEKTVRYKKLRIFQPAATANSLALLYKKTVRKLIYDQDIIEIPVSMYLRERAAAAALQYDENWAAAQQHLQLAEQALDGIIRGSTSGSEDAVMTRPWIRPRLSGGRFTIGRP